MDLNGKSRAELVDLLIQLASSLKDEDLQDPETFALTSQLVSMLDDKPETLPQELVDQLGQIQDKADRFRQAAMYIGAGNPEAMKKLQESMKAAGLMKSDGSDHEYSADEVVSHFKQHDSPGEHQARCEAAIRKHPTYHLTEIHPETTDHKFHGEVPESKGMIADYRKRTTEAPAIIVRHDPEYDDQYKIIDGVHRTKAAVANGRSRIKAFVASKPLGKAESAGKPTSVEAQKKKAETAKMWKQINKYHPDKPAAPKPVKKGELKKSPTMTNSFEFERDAAPEVQPVGKKDSETHVHSDDLGNGLHHHVFQSNSFVLGGGKAYRHMISKDADPSKPGVSHLNGFTPGEGSKSKRFAISRVNTPKEHRGNGYSYAAHKQAVKFHGSAKSDTQLTPEAHKVWERMSKDPDMNVQLREDDGDTDFAQPHLVDFKKSELEKGAMARLHPYNPQNISEHQEAPVSSWQRMWTSGNGEDTPADHRNAIEYEHGPARARFLNKLMGATKARRAKDGGREFMLHRGMGQAEHAKSVKDGHAHGDHNDSTSWTPRHEIAHQFAGQSKGHVVSAWIHEKDILAVPKQYGRLTHPDNIGSMDEQGNPTPKPKGPNTYSQEHEVIVDPVHRSPLASPEHVKEAKRNYRPLSVVQRAKARSKVDALKSERASDSDWEAYIGAYEDTLEKSAAPKIKPPQATGIHDSYKDVAQASANVMFRAKIKGREMLTKEIPLHSTVKTFDDPGKMPIDEIHQKVKELGIERPNPQHLKYETSIVTSPRNGNQYYMLKLHGMHPQVEKFYEHFRGHGITYPKYMAHVTIDKDLYDKVNKEGLQPHEVEFSPLMIEHGANNPTHIFSDSYSSKEHGWVPRLTPQADEHFPPKKKPDLKLVKKSEFMSNDLKKSVQEALERQLAKGQDEKGNPVRGSNKRLQQAKVFGKPSDAKVDKKGVAHSKIPDANGARTSPERMKMMNTIKDYASKKMGANMVVAEGKRDESGKLKAKAPIEKEPFDVFSAKGHAEEKARQGKINEINAAKPKGEKPIKRVDPKPDHRSGNLETQPSPDAAVHEIAHEHLAPLGMGIKEHQTHMDKEWGQSQKDHGHMQQKKTAGEIQPMAAENPIRRELGIPANRTGQKVANPKAPVEGTVDNSGPRFNRAKDSKGAPTDLMRQSKLLHPEMVAWFTIRSTASKKGRQSTPRSMRELQTLQSLRRQ